MEGIKTFSRQWDEAMEVKAREWFMKCYGINNLGVSESDYTEPNTRVQIDGTDVFIKGAHVDEKCGLHYAVAGTKNFCFELEHTLGVPGWFINPNSNTEKYSLMIPRAKSIEDLEAGKLTGMTWCLVSKSALYDYCINILGKDPRSLSSYCKRNVTSLRKGCGVIRCQLPEKPLVLLIPINEVLKLAEYSVETKEAEL